MTISINLVRMLNGIDPSIREVLYAILEEIEKQQKERVTKDEFNELKDIVADLSGSVQGLAEAQKRTEARVSELAEAQKRTEARVSELAEAQKRTEARVSELAEAQKKTEEEVKKLVVGLRETRKMVGGLSDSVGYGLEDRAIKGLPALLLDRNKLKIKERLARKFVSVNGKYYELNIFGKAEKDGKEYFIVGEAKAHLSKKHVDAFKKSLNKLKEYRIISDNVFPVLITYSAKPDVEAYAKEKHIALFWSYEF